MTNLPLSLKVGIIYYDTMTAFDFAGPAIYIQNLKHHGVQVEFITIATKSGLVQTDLFAPAHATISLANAPKDLDILIIPGGAPYPNDDKPLLLEYFRALAPRADLLSICTGSGLLAEAGLLEGKKATSNKVFLDIIASGFPSVNWQKRARWVVEGNIWTGSGIAAGTDMGHAYVATKFGREIADDIARRIEYVPNVDANNDPFENSKAELHPPPMDGSVPQFHVGIVVFDTVNTLNYVGATCYFEGYFFADANARIPKFTTISSTIGKIQPDASWIPVHSMTSFENAPERFDVLLIPGGASITTVVENKAFMEYIRKAAEQSTAVLTVASGAAILAATGLLDGKSATTTKGDLEAISKAHANVNWQRLDRWAVDGKYWTAGGEEAALDMTHSYIASTIELATANRLAQLMERVANLDPTNDPFA